MHEEAILQCCKLSPATSPFTVQFRLCNLTLLLLVHEVVMIYFTSWGHNLNFLRLSYHIWIIPYARCMMTKSTNEKLMWGKDHLLWPYSQVCSTHFLCYWTCNSWPAHTKTYGLEAVNLFYFVSLPSVVFWTKSWLLLRFTKVCIFEYGCLKVSV